jgi:DNA-directed RNA polymerase sigma subunit (sigma70/sigma32)
VNTILPFGAEMSFEEIAEKMGLSRQQVEAAYTSAIRKLKMSQDPEVKKWLEYFRL